jgi:uncharacterized protein
MKSAILVHGTPSKEEYLESDSPAESNKHWFPWLQKQLIVHGIHTWVPEMPAPYAPNYDRWREEFERYPVNGESLLVGHSCGGGFLVRWLSENRIATKRTILVAPWLDPNKQKCSEFFNFQIDPQLAARTDLRIFASDNDGSDINVSVNCIVAAFPKVIPKMFKAYGHFCLSDMGTETFPALLDALVE